MDQGGEAWERERGRPLLFHARSCPAPGGGPRRAVSSPRGKIRGLSAGHPAEKRRTKGGTSCGNSTGQAADRERDTKRGPGSDTPGPLCCLFRKYPVQLHETPVKHVDFCHVFPPIVFMNFQGAIAILQKHLYGLVFWVHNPVFPNPRPLV